MARIVSRDARPTLFKNVKLIEDISGLSPWDFSSWRILQKNENATVQATDYSFLPKQMNPLIGYNGVQVQHPEEVDITHISPVTYLRFFQSIYKETAWKAKHWIKGSALGFDQNDVYIGNRIINGKKEFYKFLGCLCTNMVWDYACRYPERKNTKCSCPFTLGYRKYWERCGMLEYVESMNIFCDCDLAHEKAFEYQRDKNDGWNGEKMSRQRRVQREWTNKADLYHHCHLKGDWYHRIIERMRMAFDVMCIWPQGIIIRALQSFILILVSSLHALNLDVTLVMFLTS